MEGNGPCLDTVRALHQTVVSLRAALEQSRSEILELKGKAWPLESVESALRALSIENHVLRRKILENGVQSKKRVTIASPPVVESPKDNGNRCSGLIKNKSHSLENLSAKSTTILKNLSISKTVSYSNINDPSIMDNSKTTNMEEVKQNSLENNENPVVTVTQPRNSLGNSQSDLDQDQEVDDIELIFTTDDTKDSDFKEQLVSIETDENSKRLQCATSDADQTLDISDRELEDDVFKENDVATSRNASFELKRDTSQLCASRSDNSINHEEKSLRSCYSYQDSSFENKSLEKDESFDRFEERIRIIETDISKVGIQDVEYATFRRNTCPNPLQYRPIAHR